MKKLRVVCTFFLAFAGVAFAQDPAQIQPAPAAALQSAPSTVPRLISFNGTIRDSIGKPLSGPLSVTFSLFAHQEGGLPLWSETQMVEADAQGKYTVFLGATNPTGLPLNLFTTGAARWLAIEPGVPGAVELSRVLLVGVPYALKAADADTLGGKPASAFLTAGSQVTQASTSPAVAAPLLVGVSPAATPATTPTGGGTTDYVPLWTSSTNLGNSILFQSSGAMEVNGPLELPALGRATKSTGYGSQPFDLFASSLDVDGAPMTQHFRWQAEPVGNDTNVPSGQLALLYGIGTSAPAETGLSINTKGQITFASGQTLPSVITGNETISGNLSLTGDGNLFLTGSINQVLTLQADVEDPNTGNASANVIGGYGSITNGATGATIGGGGTPAAGLNTVSDDFGTVGGGAGNTAGKGNGVSMYATVAGGFSNTAGGAGATVSGGEANVASGANATVGGGVYNKANGAESTVAGGYSNTASGDYSFAAGRYATASDTGSFLWCQGGNSCTSEGTNSFVVAANGQISFYDGPGGAGCKLAPGSGSWACSSDRNLKDNIRAIDSRSVLERVAQMPISQWSMKADIGGHNHIGPMAQDFFAAFGLGDNNKYIAQGDAQGVALASIQGLYQLVREKDEQIRSLVREKGEEIQALKMQLQALEG